MKVLTILGARPQFIKAGSVSREFSKHIGIDEVIVHTGQHYDANMSDVFFDEMKIPKPKYFLGIGGKTHGAMTGQMMEKIEEVANKEKPDWILVYGDTNSTLAGALVASKLRIKLAHIEAGLRSYNMNMPEEVNRILTDRVSDLLLCPTETAVANLEREGFGTEIQTQVLKSGDVMQDGAVFYQGLSKKPASFDVDSENFILSTIHRAENTDDPTRLSNIFNALNETADKLCPIVLPLHPRTRKIVAELNLDISDNIQIVEPVGYLEMVWLIDNCKFVMTDSGGLQKEAFFFKKYCVTLRDETEWTELVELGVNILVGADPIKIMNASTKASGFDRSDSQELFKKDLYGGGLASSVIAKALLDH